GYTNALLESRYQRLVGTKNPRILRMTGFIGHAETDRLIYTRIPGTRIAYLSIYALVPENRDRIAAFLDEFRPEIIHGYPSAIQQLAILFSDGVVPGGLSPSAVITTSETLQPNHRSDIE